MSDDEHGIFAAGQGARKPQGWYNAERINWLSGDVTAMSIEEHGRQVGEHIRATQRARLEALVAMHPPCPADGLPGSYVGLIGSFGTARLTFVCPNQDAFTYNPDTSHEWLIPQDDQRFIRLETFDLLKHDDQVQQATEIEQVDQPELPPQ